MPTYTLIYKFHERGCCYISLVLVVIVNTTIICYSICWCLYPCTVVLQITFLNTMVPSLYKGWFNERNIKEKKYLKVIVLDNKVVVSHYVRYVVFTRMGRQKE